jgi:hypothetical protein
MDLFQNPRIDRPVLTLQIYQKIRQPALLRPKEGFLVRHA